MMETCMRPRSLILLAAASLVVAACSVGPDYVKPAVDVPPAFKEAGQWKPAGAEVPAVDAEWWKVLGDAVLDDLEAQVVVSNQNLKVAEAQYRSARAAVTGARAAYFPTLSAAVAKSRGRTNSGVAGVDLPVTTTDTVSASVSWEIDVWGRIRRSVESARAGAAASAADLAAARLSTQALLAQTYVQLRAADTQVDLYQHTVDDYTRFLGLTRNRQAAGVASPLDVAQAETQLDAAQAQLIDLQNQRAQLEHALATLVGRMPAQLSLPAEARLPPVPPAPALVPSALLESRPDIVAAERRVAAANAQIGVAKSAWFPVLDLTGTGGYRGSSFAGLISAPNRFWSIGPSLAMTLLDFGARSATVTEAEAGYDEAVATYRQTVLTAFQEVEDNLAAARLLEQENQAQARTVAAARRSREIAENQYKAGTIDALNAISAQTAELSAEANSVSLASRRLQAAVQLLKNTGGAVALASANSAD
jgi:NodT family efflux transporter outer membrane factor (OMF) lipoprotein